MGLQVTLVPIKDDDDDLEPFHMLENATRDSSHQSNNHIVGWCDDEIIPEKKKSKYIFSGRSSTQQQV